MNYLLENLGEDRFQALSQALIAKEQSGAQCFPVRQPDGGRDAITLHRMQLHRMHEREAGFLVFQVKFVRNPSAIKDPHKWLIATLEKEAPKLENLIPKGAQAYYIITNVPGTSHLNTGSIDRVQSILSQSISVPAQCWWRDDLLRRLDNAWDIKWSYPEIMSGTDILRMILEDGLSDHAQRRTDAVRAFLSAQYDMDRELKFKQVELQNDLLSLFVDVPVALKQDRAEWVYQAPNGSISDPFYVEREDMIPGAADMLLRHNFGEGLPQMVLEGAPGQGKSTIVQYVCQVYRILALSVNDDLAKVPEHLIPKGRLIPIKVELRDFATWLTRKNPFTVSGEETLSGDWQPSLEAFLTALIRHSSGGFEFSVADLHAVSRISSLLLVLDGFDEVADIGQRLEIVREVKTGVNRLRANAASLRVIITSRPAAFANSPGFPEKDFPQVTLSALSHTMVLNYAEKWISSKRIEGRGASEIRKVLKSKLQQPHLRDLECLS